MERTNLKDEVRIEPDLIESGKHGIDERRSQINESVGSKKASGDRRLPSQPVVLVRCVKRQQRQHTPRNPSSSCLHILSLPLPLLFHNNNHNTNSVTSLEIRTMLLYPSLPTHPRVYPSFYLFIFLFWFLGCQAGYKRICNLLILCITHKPLEPSCDTQKIPHWFPNLNQWTFLKNFFTSLYKFLSTKIIFRNPSEEPSVFIHIVRFKMIKWIHHN